jgi:hypothetical protein
LTRSLLVIRITLARVVVVYPENDPIGVLVSFLSLYRRLHKRLHGTV